MYFSFHFSLDCLSLLTAHMHYFVFSTIRVSRMVILQAIFALFFIFYVLKENLRNIICIRYYFKPIDGMNHQFFHNRNFHFMFDMVNEAVHTGTEYNFMEKKMWLLYKKPADSSLMKQKAIDGISPIQQHVAFQMNLHQS